MSPTHAATCHRHRLATTAERGSVALTLGLLVAAVGTAAAVVVLTVADLAATSGRAGIAADAAALAAISASPLARGDGRPCKAAGALAAANGAQLTRCLADAQDGWPLRVEVHVRATPSSPWLRRLAPPLTARAAAVARPPIRPPGQPTARSTAQPPGQLR